jgi:hypothetical protein
VTVFAGYDELLAFLHLRYQAPITVISRGTPTARCHWRPDMCRIARLASSGAVSFTQQENLR